MNTARLTRACLAFGMAFVITIASSLGVIAPAGAQTANGSLAGHITQNNGAPAAGLLFVSNLDGTVVRYVNPNGTGAYEILDLPAGEYTAEFTTSWNGRHRVQPNPVVVAGTRTTLDIVLPPVGALRGRFTARDGAGVGNLSVDLSGGPSTRTAADGSWRIDRAFARDDYTVHFWDWSRVEQYAYGKLRQTEADRIAVRGGETTVVDDMLLPTGSVRVTARDSVTGAAIARLFAFAHTRSGLTETGELILTDVPVGTHDVRVSAPGYLGHAIVRVTVMEGQQAQVAATLTPEARIEVSVIEASTGLALPEMCVVVFGPLDPLVCPEWTDGQGRFSIGNLAAGTYQLFVIQANTQCECKAYGAQWVGSNGGTGKRVLAASIRVSAGQTVSAPVVKMDPAGTVTGRVTLPDGSPATSGTAGLLPLPPEFPGHEPLAAAPIGADGQYTHHFVGPYEWPVYFAVDGQAPQYGGGTGNYLFAQTFTATSGATARHDVRLRQGVAVTTNVTGGGQGERTIYAHNAITGDIVGVGTTDNSGRATFSVVGPQFLRFSVLGQRHPSTFWIPPHGARTFDLTFS